MSEKQQQAIDRLGVKLDWFIDIQIWPAQVRHFDPRGWLNNFQEEDRPLATLLLDSFNYIPDWMVDTMLFSGVQDLSYQESFSPRRSLAVARWQEFLDRSWFCMVTGEEPHPTDSGHLFLRKARDYLGLPQRQLHDPCACLQALVELGGRPVIFVDDFVGTGNQFSTLWRREYQLQGGKTLTFEKAAKEIEGTRCYFVPIVATGPGAERISLDCDVTVAPVHLVDPTSSPWHPDSTVFPPDLRVAGVELIERYSRVCGIAQHQWRGHGGLGTMLAFGHGAPDSTPPLFTHSAANWRPLVRRP